jgi:branched-chain amino acid transport system permease protein
MVDSAMPILKMGLGEPPGAPAIAGDGRASRHSTVTPFATRPAIVGGVLLLAVAAVLPAVLNPYYVKAASVALLYAYLAASWNVVGGYAGQMSLGHVIFFGIGSYSVALWTTFKLGPFLVAAPAAVALSAVVAWVIASICFRYSLRGMYFAVGTLLLAEIVRIAAVNTEILGRSQGLQYTPPSHAIGLQYYVFLVVAALVTVGSRWLERSRLGYELVALREQEESAEALGIDTSRAKRRAFVLSAVLTAFGGFLYGCFMGYVEPGYDLSMAITLIMIMGAVLGGRGTAVGPLVGGAIVLGIQELLTFLGSAVGTTSVSAFAQMIYGLFFVVIVLIFPQGVIGVLLRWRADRLAYGDPSPAGRAARE